MSWREFGDRFGAGSRPLTVARVKRVDVAIAVVRRGGRVLICRRPDGGHLGGFWEFPGGKLEAGESLEQCVAREVAEEVCITVRVVAAMGILEHEYPAVHVRLHPYLCEHEGGEPRAVACAEVRWVRPGELGQYRFPPANDRLLEEIARRLDGAATADVPATSPNLPA